MHDEKVGAYLMATVPEKNGQAIKDPVPTVGLSNETVKKLFFDLE